MAYYRVTVIVAFEGKKSAIKYQYAQDVDIVYDLYYSKARSYYGPKLLKFDCTRLSERSEAVKQYKEYLKSKRNRG
jgi:hypothetical protein